jgi:predicted N-formylglutamate amidohydrolase
VTGLVLSCEHASWTLPPGLDLGVSPDVLRSQASWDHGALDIATRLSEAVGLPVHAGAFSRMFVDLNRHAEHPDVIPLVSYGAMVPGNAALTPGDRAARLDGFHAPYWEAVRRDVIARIHDRGSVLHFSSHTFDPALDPMQRTYEVGVLYDTGHALEAQLAERLLFQLRRAGLDVGAPYAGIQFETSHAVTYRAGGCARVAAAIAAFLDTL